MVDSIIPEIESLSGLRYILYNPSTSVWGTVYVCVQRAPTAQVFLVQTARCGRPQRTAVACTAATMTPSYQWSITAPAFPRQFASEQAKWSSACPMTPAAVHTKSAVSPQADFFSLFYLFLTTVKVNLWLFSCYSAVCNQSLCDHFPPECKYGEKLVSYYRADSCCPDYVCGEFPFYWLNSTL